MVNPLITPTIVASCYSSLIIFIVPFLICILSIFLLSLEKKYKILHWIVFLSSFFYLWNYSWDWCGPSIWKLILAGDFEIKINIISILILLIYLLIPISYYFSLKMKKIGKIIWIIIIVFLVLINLLHSAQIISRLLFKLWIGF